MVRHSLSESGRLRLRDCTRDDSRFPRPYDIRRPNPRRCVQMLDPRRPELKPLTCAFDGKVPPRVQDLPTESMNSRDSVHAFTIPFYFLVSDGNEPVLSVSIIIRRAYSSRLRDRAGHRAERRHVDLQGANFTGADANGSSTKPRPCQGMRLYRARDPRVADSHFRGPSPGRRRGPLGIWMAMLSRSARPRLSSGSMTSSPFTTAKKRTRSSDHSSRACPALARRS